MERRGVADDFMLPETVEGGRKDETQDRTKGDGDECAKICSGNHSYFCSFRLDTVADHSQSEINTSEKGMTCG